MSHAHVHVGSGNVGSGGEIDGRGGSGAGGEDGPIASAATPVTGAQQPRLPTPAGRWRRAHDPAAQRALSWCAGEVRPAGSSLHDYMQRARWVADEEDVLRSPAHDICSGRYFQSRLRKAKEGQYGFFVCGPPCRTFSVSRFRPGYARPLRRRSAGGRIPSLTAAERWDLDEADLIVDRTCAVAAAVWASGGDFVIENPIDRGAAELPEGVTREPDHFSLWQTAPVQRLVARTGAVFIHFPQCALGLEFQKWTTLLCSPTVAARLQHLSEMRCSHHHVQAAGGYDADGVVVGPRAARYPDLLLRALAAAGAAALPSEHFTPSMAPASAASRREAGQLLRAGLAGWKEAPAFERGLGAEAADVGRFSLAALLPERQAAARRLAFESAEYDVVRTPPRECWRVRTTRRAEAPLEAPDPLLLAPVAVGHARRWRRPGFTSVWVGRGRDSLLGNPFLLDRDPRDAATRASSPLRAAVCDAYAELLRGPAQAGEAARTAALFGGLAFDASLDTEAAARGRHDALLSLAARVRAGERLELTCTCHPLACHAEAVRAVLLELVGARPAPARSAAAQVDPAWRPRGGAAGLFHDPADWDQMQQWRRAALTAWAAMARGDAFEAPPDLHIPAARMRPEARALGPWVTGGAAAEAPYPVAAYAEVPPCGLRAQVFQAWAAAHDGDQAIASELPWGLEDEAEGLDILLAFHHSSCWEDSRYAQAVVDVVAAEGPAGTGWLQDSGDIPFVPLRCVPKGVVDQVHKLRVVTDHTHPFGYFISANDGVDLAALPDLKFSSGVKFARIVGVLDSAGVGVLMWKRDAVSAYRQVPIHPCDLWKCGMAGPRGILIDSRLSFGARMAPNKFQRLMLVAVQEATAQIAAFDAAHPPVDPRVLAWLEERAPLDGADGAALDGRRCRLSGVVQYIDDTLGCSVNDFIPSVGAWRGERHAGIFDAVMATAGVEMAEGAKCVNAEDEVEALGVMVSAAEGVVYYPEKKRLRLEELIDDTVALALVGPVPRARIESLVGKEKWVAHVAPALGPHLTSAYAALQHATSRGLLAVSVGDEAGSFVTHQREIRRTLASQPRRPLIPRSEFPPLDHAASTVVAQDASGSWGIGGYVLHGAQCTYFAEPYPPVVAEALRRREISICSTELAAELAAVMIALESGASVQYITDFTDNEAARVAATRGTSTSVAMAPLAHELAAVMVESGCALRTLRVTTKENELADHLSRDGDTAPLVAAIAAAKGRLRRVAVPERVWALLLALV